MAGAMRKMGVYLGLVEDDDRRGELGEYEEYDEYAEAEVVPVRRVAAGRGWEDAAESRSAVAHHDGYREPAYRELVDEPPATGSRRCTRGRTTRPGPSASTSARAFRSS